MENKISHWYSGPFVENLKKELIKLCSDRGFLNGQFYDIAELQKCWHDSAPQYMADSVPEIAHYPTVAIAWACFYGMGAGALWDTVWNDVKDKPDLYVYIRDARGFDNMDDYVLEGLLNLKNNPTRREELTRLIQDCAELAHTLIRKECLEPQTKEAFYMFAKTEETMFELGVSLELFALGYKYEKLDLNMDDLKN